MSSTFGGLNTMVRGLHAQQVSLDTVGHNVANANTAGYTRQAVDLATTTPETIYNGTSSAQKGTGVSVTAITRARDALVDKQMWKETSSLNYGQAAQAGLAKIESAFGEPKPTGVQSVLNKFWDSIQTLATNASDVGLRTAVREHGVALVNTVQHSAQQLKDMVSDINSLLDIKVSSINQTAAEIGSLNKQIRNIEAGGMDHANDLRDKRDLLVDQLSALVDVRVMETRDGTYTIQSGSIMLVVGDEVKKLTTETPTGVAAKDADYGYEIKNISSVGDYQPLNVTNGELKGLLDMRDSRQFGVKGYLDKLSTMSQFLLQDFNQVNRSGYGTDNSTNNNFFGKASGVDPDYATDLVSGGFTKGDWLATLKVNPSLFNNADGLAKIAAKSTGDHIGVRQSNTLGGAGTIVSSIGTYTKGEKATGVMVKAFDSTPGSILAATGQITQIRYSTDGGNNWSTTPITLSGDGTFAIPINGVTAKLQIADSINNTAGDLYNFTLSKGNIAGGDNAILLGNKLKSDMAASLGNASLDGYYTSLISSLGVQSQDAIRLTDNQKTLVEQITSWRESISGVNMDEEMANMIKYQKGYAASARVLTTIDEMLDKLINNTGVVGR